MSKSFASFPYVTAGKTLQTVCVRSFYNFRFEPRRFAYSRRVTVQDALLGTLRIKTKAETRRIFL